MSKKHPVISVTGSSGAGTTTVKKAFEHIFYRLGVNPLMIEGDSFHRYERTEMQARIAKAEEERRNFSHFSIEANVLDELENTFGQYGETGTTKRRCYIHNEEEGRRHGGYQPGTLTPWETVAAGTDLLFYEGLHGGVKTDALDVAQYTDLLTGRKPRHHSFQRQAQVQRRLRLPAGDDPQLVHVALQLDRHPRRHDGPGHGNHLPADHRKDAGGEPKA